MDRQKFKGIMAEKNVTQKELSDLLNISQATFTSKLNGKSDFYLNEVKQMINFLDLTVEDQINIFLS